MVRVGLVVGLTFEGGEDFGNIDLPAVPQRGDRVNIVVSDGVSSCRVADLEYKISESAASVRLLVTPQPLRQ